MSPPPPTLITITFQKMLLVQKKESADIQMQKTWQAIKTENNHLNVGQLVQNLQAQGALGFHDSRYGGNSNGGDGGDGEDDDGGGSMMRVLMIRAPVQP